MVRVYVGMGSNRDRENSIRGGILALQNYFSQLTVSSVYESEAVGFKGDAFYNLVVGFDTTLPVSKLSFLLKNIEDQHGRIRSDQHAFCNRTLDIDILLYDDAVGVIDGVELPRQEITENAFVLWPLSEIAGGIVHPTRHQTFHELWNAFDKNKQKLKPIAFNNINN